MSPIGSRASWRHLKDDGTPAVDLVGMIVAVERGGTPATWSALVLKDDGTMRAAAVEDLVVQDNIDFSFKVNDAFQAKASVDFLEGYLKENFPDTGPEDHPVDWAVKLIADLGAELLEVGNQRDAARASIEALESGAAAKAADIASLEEQVRGLQAKLRKKAGKGEESPPAAPQ